MSKKYIGWMALYVVAMLTITLLGTLLQFTCIGNIMPIWNWKYSATEAYACVAFLWALLPFEYLVMADDLKTLQELDGLETSDE